MKALTIEEMRLLPEGTIIYDKSNEMLWRTWRGWRYSEILEDGSYLETLSHTANMLWGPMTLEPKGPEWGRSKLTENAKDMIDGLSAIWDEADRDTQDLMVEMVKEWYLKNMQR